MKLKLSIAACALICVFGQASFAADNPLDRILGCAEITDDAERLTCFDSNARDLKGEVDSGDVVALGPQDIQRAERQSFGLPSFSIGEILSGLSPGRGAPAETALAETARSQDDQVREVRDNRGGISALEQVPVASVEHSWDQKLVITLGNGQVWRQTDSRFIPLPRRGREVTADIQQASLGSYFMQLSYTNARFRASRE